MAPQTLRGCLEHPLFRLAGLVLFFLAYLTFGAAVFQEVEWPVEQGLVTDLRAVRHNFSLLAQTCVSEEQLELFIEKVVGAANRGVSATRNVTMSEPNWSFGQALFFSSTVLTTIGYGRVTPLSDAGKAFCIVYAVLGIPLTLILFTALTERLLIPVKAVLYFLFRKMGHVYKAFHIQLLHLALTMAVLLTLFMLVPAAIYTVLEPSWNYLDAFYYCFISLTTIGLGDFIPGDNAEQPHRALYKVATTVYLLLGLLMMMVLISVVYDIPELNLGLHFHPTRPGAHDDEEGEESRLRRDASDMSSAVGPGVKYQKQADDAETRPVTGPGTTGNSSSTGGTYQSFHDQHVDDDV
ncbi:potassium channel subfamily K member 1-like isoform X1 [Babylonia areolata]|uniref:potassium channel subfamily K member 1-like isoform X1 n=1 Tax=Babylonia areolata TaxID=304850 RepID=UPI003FD532D9